MSKKRFKHDISNIEGTIGKVLLDSRDVLMASKNADELKSLVEKLFSENGISTPKSRLIESKLKKMGLTQGLMYVQNIMFAAMGMGTY